MKLDVTALIAALQMMDGRGIEGLTLVSDFPVCAGPPAVGLLTEEEYAPVRAAADLRHDTYMRLSGRILVPGDALYGYVSVNGTVVAWLAYDGTVRTTRAAFDDKHMNMIRTLAAAHLGQFPKVQQELADLRGDIDRMSVGGFTSSIFELLDRCGHGSKTNDWPASMTFRQWQDANKKPSTEQGRRWSYPMNPTREYTDTERAEWAGEAHRYLTAFRERFPTAFEQWMTRRWFETSWNRRARGGPIEVKADDRLLIDIDGALQAAVVVIACRGLKSYDPHADLMLKRGLRTWVRLHPGQTIRYEDLRPDQRAAYAEAWNVLLKEAQEYGGPEFQKHRYDN